MSGRCITPASRGRSHRQYGQTYVGPSSSKPTDGPCEEARDGFPPFASEIISSLLSIGRGKTAFSSRIRMNSRFKKPLKIWPQRGIFALLDQGLISGSNFAIAVL